MCLMTETFDVFLLILLCLQRLQSSAYQLYRSNKLSKINVFINLQLI